MRVPALLLVMAIAAASGCGNGDVSDNHPDADPGRNQSRNHQPGNHAPGEGGTTAGESDGRTARPGGAPATPTRDPR